MRRSVETAVLLAMLALALHYFLVLGFVVPIVITSGSMATGLVGPHRHVVCKNCSEPFDVGEEAIPSNRLAVCPNCGSSQNPLNEIAVHGGNRLLVNRAAFAQRDPRRWEVVVFDCPQKPGDLCIKRIVALPGERVQIRDGNLYADHQPGGKFVGEILRKPLGLLRELAVVVYDDQFQGQKDPQRWQLSDGWMNYEHLAPVYGSYGAPSAGPIMDDMSYNQNESRLLAPAHDLMLRVKGQATNDKPVGFRIVSGGIEYQVRLDSAAGRGDLLEDGQQIAEFVVPADVLRRPSLVEFAVADQQVIFAVDGHELLNQPLKKVPFSGAADLRPIGYSANFASTHTVVLRDVYYTSGFGQMPTLHSPPIYRLAGEEYFVLGDNSPLSEDSRTWPVAGVPAKSIVGNVLASW